MHKTNFSIGVEDSRGTGM